MPSRAPTPIEKVPACSTVSFRLLCDLFLPKQVLRRLNSQSVIRLCGAAHPLFARQSLQQSLGGGGRTKFGTIDEVDEAIPPALRR